MDATILAARIAAHVTTFAADTANAILTQSAESAGLALEYGWDPDGDVYDLTGMPGDEQALSDRLGRKAERDEARALELCVRDRIAAARSLSLAVLPECISAAMDARDNGGCDAESQVFVNKLIDMEKDDAARLRWYGRNLQRDAERA